MTSFGILMPAIRPPHTVKDGDKRTLQIRSRRAKDLDILRARYMLGALGPTIHTPKFDYEYRAYCTPEDFALAMYQMVLEIDYKKFKPTTTDLYEDDELHDAYNAIWSTVLRMLSTPKHRYDYWRPSQTGNTANTGVSLYKPGQHAAAPPVDPFTQPYTHSTVQAPEVLQATAADWTDNTADYYVTGDDTYPLDNLRKALGLKDEDVESYTVMQLCNIGWKRIDDVMDVIYSDAYVSHKDCKHTFSDGADKKCERRRTEKGEAEIDEIRRAITLVELSAGYGETSVLGSGK